MSTLRVGQVVRVGVGGFARKPLYHFAVLLDDMSGKFRFILPNGRGYTQTEEQIMAVRDHEPKRVLVRFVQLGYESAQASSFFCAHFHTGHELRIENAEVVFDVELSVFESSTEKA